MKRVQRAEVLPRAEYEKIRPGFRENVMKEKDERRIHLGEHLTFLFETHTTILYQVQEMMRSEQMDGEPEIRHEIETYNELLGERGELGCTLMIEIDDKDKRDQLLRAWTQLPKHLKMRTSKGLVAASFDERQLSESRLSSVQYLKFKLGDQMPLGLVCDLPSLPIESTLNPKQAAALAKDLIS